MLRIEGNLDIVSSKGTYKGKRRKGKENIETNLHTTSWVQIGEKELKVEICYTKVSKEVWIEG